MSEIHVKDGESIDSALKRFKRSCAKAGVIAEVRKREHYEGPDVYKRQDPGFAEVPAGRGGPQGKSGDPPHLGRGPQGPPEMCIRDSCAPRHH